MTAEQFHFDLTPLATFRKEAFVVSQSNEAAWKLVNAWPEWPQAAICLVGPRASGKTHLLHIWADRVEAHILRGSLLSEENLLQLRHHKCIALEEADEVVDQPAFFHLFNQISNSEGSLLMAARSEPARWSVDLPDLRSRLNTVPDVPIGSPDDALLGDLIKKQFEDRQVEVHQDVVSYMVNRIERSYGMANRVVDRVDRDLWERGGPLTTLRVRRVLEDIAAEDAVE